ncbi:hypothetical protein CK203_105881 [Vitis vinifera]|uniref:Retrotransposon gag domain-containing protein n=1 Tax=Vitis vinifera TaxID=29760 RepID=A0A438DE80_VITVI|nr:hypothetical protein CK203_105881 [Vitis vinifera]
MANARAPAGHESTETPIGNESNDAVAEEGANFIVILFRCTCGFHHKFVIVDTSCVCQSGYEIVEEGLLNLKHLIQGVGVDLNIMENTLRISIVTMCPYRAASDQTHIVPLLPTFHGMESENPYAHIKEFEDVCNTFREGGASIDLMRLKLFPFTLKDKAKIWLNSLRPRSIRTWTDLQAEFLKKFFPTHRTNGLKRQISNFSAKENEKFYECWERYMEAINACPHHGLIHGVGDFMSKNPEEAMDFLSYVAEVSRGWDEPHRGEVEKMKSQPMLFMLRWDVHLE